jgi:hypothetical protein
VTDPLVECDWCERIRNVMLHRRAEHPPTAAKRWLKKTCKEPLVHDNLACAGCSGHLIRPCEFLYRAGAVFGPRAPDV